MDRIITIQFQELHRNTGVPIGRLEILKEWEYSEKQILDEFIRVSKAFDPYPFTFTPVGYDLNFVHNFLLERCRRNGIPPIHLLKKPFIDLRAFGIIINRGEFKYSGIDRITKKPVDEDAMRKWHSKREYNQVVKYVEREADALTDFCAWLYKELPDFLRRYRHSRPKKAPQHTDGLVRR
ncbi:MAG: hypothetical protein V1708_02125 [Candidatus Micrarchaeota archaeon]